MKNERKLFGNVGGNSFKLLTESIEINPNKPPGTQQVREGLKKVFSNGGSEIPYKRLQNVGLGYIKDVTQAAKTALYEAKELAEEFGYQDDEYHQKFVKENDFSKLSAESPEHKLAQVGSEEGDMSNPEEKREVQIGKEILRLAQVPGVSREDPYPEADLEGIKRLAQELIQLHGQQ